MTRVLITGFFEKVPLAKEEKRRLLGNKIVAKVRIFFGKNQCNEKVDSV